MAVGRTLLSMVIVIVARYGKCTSRKHKPWNFFCFAQLSYLGWRQYLQSAARNATYTSPNIQNLLISILGDHICNAILRKVRSSLCYTLIADEVTDCSNKKQLCIVIRYAEPQTASVNVDLFTFLECDSDTTSKALVDKMLGFIRNHLDPSKMHGQAYNRPSNMSRKTNRAAARISSQYPLALYTHCTSHCLNLVLFELGSCGFIRGG